ncbi:glycine-rich protein-like [Hordeum vulgare subsp. vulgare]|uniref:Glycine-rich protein n=1 Tax=Hordeum vulgare subsp. vulgare TaxID=112509 RepID=A0A8I6XZ01_HORVV|nr:glycine-rich protein-like [Hordeum vulgare subsp. vulgare]
MASTKALFLLAVLLASAVLLATAASEQTHDKEGKVVTNGAGVQDDWRGGGRGGGYPGRGGGGYGPCGRWGCCRRGYHGDCIRCCRAANDVPEAMDRTEAHN